MAVQGFFSPDKKRRMAGETENNAAFSVKVEPVTIANNINKYNEQTPSLDYAPDRVGEYIKKAEEKSTYQKKIEERNRIAESFGVDPKTGPTYTERDESKFGGELLRSPFPGVPDRYITTKERITDPRYAKESGFTVTPTKFDKGTAFQIGVQFDQNKYGLTPAKVLGKDIGGMYNFKDKDYGETTKAYVAGMIQQDADLKESERIRKIDQERNPQNYNEDGSLKTLAQKYESRINLEEQVRKEMGFPSYMEQHKKRLADINTSKDDFGRPLGTMPSMTISEAGRYQAEQNRLQKAKEESKVQEQRNVFQRIGDTVGDVFNKITGTEAAGAGTLQAQGINTGATVNIAQMGNVDPVTQTARDAVAKANLRKSGLDKTIGGQSSQANYGSGRTGGFGTGTHGKGMKSNPGSQRQTGVGVSAGNLSRHKTGSSVSRSGISRSTSRGQGGGSSSRSRGGTGTGKSSQGRGGRRGGSTGGSGASSKGGTGSGRTSTSRTASKASRSRTGRSRSQCDIRTKIDISPLINSNLVKDNLAEVAYFVQEIRN
jgi:hypothetical protein